MTWLYVPGTTSALQQEEAALISELTQEQAERLAQSCSWRTKPRQPRSWSTAWKQHTFLRLLSGVTSEPSTLQRGVDEWMASLGAIPASPSPTPAPAEEPTTHATSGPPSLPGFENFNLDGASSRTSPAICRLEDTKSPETYKAWATALRKHSLQRRKSARLTDANVSSSWATPRGPKSLLAQAQWATPAARDGKDTGDNVDWEKVAAKSKLPGQAMVWLTPGANEDAAGTLNGKMQRMLSHQVQEVDRGLPDPETSTDGDESSPSAPTSRRRLNPSFVEGLMGLPIGWTSLAVTDCESWGTLLARHRPPLHGDSSGESSGSSGPVGDQWPTPRARDHHVEGVNSDDAKVYSPSLARVVERNWTTPLGDGMGGQTEPSEALRRGGGDRSLRVDAAQWQPPEATR